MAAPEDAERYIPLSVREGGGETVEQYDALHDGVPPWLARSIEIFIRKQLHSSRGYRETSISDVETTLRLVPGLNWHHDASSAFDDLIARCDANDELALDVVDFLLRRNPQDVPAILVLQDSLRTGGSAWKVGGGDSGFLLEQRVDETAARLARDAMRQGRPGEYLRDAW